MKKFLIAIMLCLPMIGMAQNSWEEENSSKVNPDQKYLVGAVPVVNGQVQFSTEIKAEGKSAEQIYEIILKYFNQLIKEDNQLEQSRITAKDSINHQLAVSLQEWLVFKNKPLVLDRTRFMYTLIAQCEDGKATIIMKRIYYLYDEERDPMTYKAEEWITDQYGLKKNKQKLSRVSGKFRRKTIDRKDYIFNKIASLLN